MTSPTPAELAVLIQELRQATEQQRHEAMAVPPATLAGEAVQTVLMVLERLQDWLPFLTELQRVMLATGAVPPLRTRAVLEIEQGIEAAWFRDGDRDEFDLRVQVMATVVRPAAVALLGRVRERLIKRLADGGQQALEVSVWSAGELELRGAEVLPPAAETPLVLEVLEGYSAVLRDGDGLVFGQVTPADAKLWRECAAVVRERGDIQGRDVMQRRVARLFNKVRQEGCVSVEQWRMRKGEKRGPWGGAREYRVNSQGQMVNGLNQAVEWRNGRYERCSEGFMDVFAGFDSREVDAEIERASAASVRKDQG